MNDGLNLITEIEGCSSCGGLHSVLNTVLGLTWLTVTSIVDGKENTTRYDYDDPQIPWEQMGEVVQKTEASGLPEERTTKYLYTHDLSHPIWVAKSRDQTQRLTPTKNTTLTLIRPGRQPVVSEKTGYIVLNGRPALKTYRRATYNPWGNPPGQRSRTDISDITKFEYYKNTVEEGNNRGQLMAMVNALGHTTLFSDYDTNGNVQNYQPQWGGHSYTYDERTESGR
jgi:hypothetical protein